MRLKVVGRSALLLATAVVLLYLVAPAATDQRGERQFIDGLVARRLFDLAEQECRDQLADDGLSNVQKVDWTVELIRILSQHAANSRSTEQPARWQAAHTVAKEFLAEHVQDPRRVLVEIQDALTSLAAGELSRMEAEVAVLPDEDLGRARDQIRTASRQLESLDKELTEQLARSGGSNEPADTLSENELFSLQNNVRFQLARAYRNQALCYPPGSDDRLAALSLAIEKLNATLTQLQLGDALTWKVYLDLAACYRLIGKLDQSERSLTAPLADSAPASVRLDALAERARVMIAAGRPQQALDELSDASSVAPHAAPELAYARLEAMLSLLKSARERKDDALADQWQKKATAVVDAIEQNCGNYWGHRANLALLAASGDGIGSGNIAILSRAANRLYREGQFDKAIEKYEQAAVQARAIDDLQSAFRFGYLAALIEQEQGHHAAAAERLRRLALQQKSQPQAPEAHRLAAWNLAQVVRSDASVTDQYIGLLTEHLEEWPQSDTSNTVREWLGRLYENQDKWEAAIEAYRAIAADAPQFPDAVTALARCWQKLLVDLQSKHQPIQPAYLDATKFFDTLILGPQKHWPERWSQAQRTAAVATARLRLEFSRENLVDAQRVLQTALDNSPDAPRAWREEAQSLLIVALAGQPGQQGAAAQMLQDFSSGSTDRLLELINGLSSLAETAPASLRAPLAQLQLTALDRLSTNAQQLDARQRLRIEQVRAGALRASGKADAALELFRRLADQQPNNGAIQLEYAGLLLESNDKQNLTTALQQWQKVARRVRPGTDDWFRARYSIALALYKRNQPAAGQTPGDRAVAVQRLEYLKATTRLDQTNWKTKVDELLRQCQDK